MTGTGTQTDPYVVDNWADFVTTVGTQDAYIKFADGGGEINMNGIAAEGVPTTTICCAGIDGNGWKLRSLYFKNAIAFHLNRRQGTKITNLHFTDFQGDMFSGGSLFETSPTLSSKCQFERCSFSGRADGGGAVFEFGSYDYVYGEFYRCALKLNCHESVIPFSTSNRAVPLEYCNIYINCENKSYKSVCVSLKNSYMQGNIRGGLHFICNEGPNYNSIVNADIGGDAGQHGASYYSNILINSDKVTGTINSSFKQVTTAQLKNAAYLSSIGFPIRV